MEKKKEQHCVHYKKGEKRMEKSDDASLGLNNHTDKSWTLHHCFAHRGAAYVVNSTWFWRLNLDPIAGWKKNMCVRDGMHINNEWYFVRLCEMDLKAYYNINWYLFILISV